MDERPAPIPTDAAHTLALIEYRTAHILHKRLQAARILLGRPVDFSVGKDSLPTPTLAELEQHVAHWAPLIAAAAETDANAQLSDLLAVRHGFTMEKAPGIGWALAGGDGTAADAAAHDPTEPGSVTPRDEMETAVFNALTWRYLTRGETLFTEGDLGDQLHVLVDGLLRATSSRPEFAPLDLGPGGVFGEASLLTGEPWLYTVRAVRECDLAVMDRATFEQLVHEYPAIMRRLATQLAGTLRSGRPTQLEMPRATVVTLLPTTPAAAAFSQALAAELARFGTTLHFSAHDMAALVKQEVGAALEDFVDEYGFVDWLQAQAHSYRFIIYSGDLDFPHWTRRALEQADRILVIGQAQENGAMQPLEEAVLQLPDLDLMPAADLVLLHPTKTASPGNTRAWLHARPWVTHHHHVALDSGEGVDRVARFVRGKAIGLVFGGGGMRSVACYGVARYLDEQGIRADVVGGTSGGAIVAALYAMGGTAQEMLEITKTRLLKRKILMQPTLPLVSVMQAGRVVDAYKEVFGEAHMEELWTTAYTISGNLTQAAMCVHRTGPLWHAVRASTAIAGIFPPALTDEGDLLIDGGIFNNTPADVARSMVGRGPVVAVDLGFTVRQRIPYDYGDSLSGWKVFWNKLNPFAATMPTPSIVGIMMRANALGSINATGSQTAHADLILRPPVSDYGLFDMEAFDTIAQQGYDYAQEHVAPWLAAGGLEAGGVEHGGVEDVA